MVSLPMTQLPAHREFFPKGKVLSSAAGVTCRVCGLLLLFLLGSCRYGPEVEQITVLFTGDLEGQAAGRRGEGGGLARISVLKKQIVAENPRTILLDAGDAVVGTALATETRGEAIVRLMNLAGYDAAGLGNHEFDLGPDQVARYKELADFTYLAANVRDASGALVADAAYQVFTLGRVRLAVIGVTNPNTVHLVDPEKIRGLIFSPAELAIRRAQDEIADSAEVVILLSHQGLGEDSRLTRRLQGIELILGGHSQVAIHGLRLKDGVRIMHAGQRGEYLGRVDLYYDVNRKKVVKWKGRLLRVKAGIPGDPKVKAALEAEKEALPVGLEQELCRLWWGKGQTELGHWVAEVIKKRTGTDFGVINTGGVRTGLSRGPVTPADLYEIMPFNDRLARFEIKGRELEQLRNARHLYFSSGPKIEPNRNYSVGSADFLLRINEFPGARHPVILDVLLRRGLEDELRAGPGRRCDM